MINKMFKNVEQKEVIKTSAKMVDNFNIFGYCHFNLFFIYVIAKFFIWLSDILRTIIKIDHVVACIFHPNTLMSYSEMSLAYICL